MGPLNERNIITAYEFAICFLDFVEKKFNFFNIGEAPFCLSFESFSLNCTLTLYQLVMINDYILFALRNAIPQTHHAVNVALGLAEATQSSFSVMEGSSEASSEEAEADAGDDGLEGKPFPGLVG